MSINKTISILCQDKKSHGYNISRNILLGITQEQVHGNIYDLTDIDTTLTQLTKSDAIIFGSPTFFGSVSSEIKAFMDKTTRIWKNRLWRNKIAASYTYSSSLNGDKMSVLQQLFIFAQQHGMIWVGLDLNSCTKNKNTPSNFLGSWIGLMSLTPSNNIYDIHIDQKTAQYFGSRIAKITKNINFHE